MMRSATGTARRVRVAAVLALGAFALHQLRYLIAFGGSSSTELARQGHGYMTAAAPGLAAMAAAALIATVLRARFGEGLAKASLVRRTAIFTLSLLAIFATQESLEGMLAPGHPSGVVAIFAGGGCIAFPLALLIGALAALLIRALEGLEIAIAGRRTSAAVRRPPRSTGHPMPSRGPRPAHLPMAFGLARRPPPGLPA